MTIAGASEKIAGKFFDKGGYRFNIRHPDYGCDPTGVVDAAAAMDACITDALAAGDPVAIPAGTFKRTTGISAGADGLKLLGAGNESIISYTGAGVACSFNGKEYCAARDFSITTATGTVGVDLPSLSHWWELYRLHLIGFSTAGVRGTSVFYGECAHCDLDTNAIGFLGASEFNGNHIHSNSIRQNLIGISIEDASSASDGNVITGNAIESARASSTYGIKIIGSNSNVVQGNRIECTVGTAHFFVNSSGSRVASFNQFIGNVLEGTIPAFILGDASGSSQVIATTILGGRAAGAMTINSDCVATTFLAAPSSYPSTLTNNSFGYNIDIDATNGKVWRSTAASAAYGYKLTVGGAGTIIDVGTTNTFDIITNAGTSLRVETNGRVRAPIGSLSAGGDSAGLAGTNTVSNGTNVAARSTGVGTIKFDDATARDCIGFMKVYLGTTTGWVPIFNHG